jgi:hypothetical protein
VQAAQNVHSNEQMRASGESGASSFWQASHLGRISSMFDVLGPETSRTEAYLNI